MSEVKRWPLWVLVDDFQQFQRTPEHVVDASDYAALEADRDALKARCEGAERLLSDPRCLSTHSGWHAERDAWLAGHADGGSVVPNPAEAGTSRLAQGSVPARGTEQASAHDTGLSLPAGERQP
jgi:hypothetical protein